MRIESIGYYLPPSTSLAAIIEKFPIGWQYPIHEKAGIENIRKASIGEYSISLSKEAVVKCLELSKYDISAIDAIICCNICKYDFDNIVTIEPATSVTLAQHFGMKEVECFDINNACAGMFTGLYSAKSMIAANTAQRVLVVSGEYITKLGETVFKESQINTKYDMRDLLASLTLGDSAVAMIVEKSEEGIGFTDIQLKTYGEYSHLCTGYPTENGPLMFTKSAELAQRASEYSANHTVNTLYENNWEEEDIRYLIPHQTAEKVIHKAIGIVNEENGKAIFDRDNTLVNLKNRGNTSTTTHFVALMDKILEGEINDGDKLVFSISASGITIGTALYTMDDLASRVRSGRVNKTSPVLTKELSKRPINVSAVSTLPSDYRGPRQTFDMIQPVVRDILSQRDATDGKIGLIIFSGSYITDNISEPAIAAMILKEIGISETEQAIYFSENLLAFDIKNGSLGTQKAMETANAIMRNNNIQNALIIASEVSQSAIKSLSDFPVETTASGILITRKPKDAQVIMIENKHYNFWKYIKDYEVGISWEQKEVGLDYKQCHCLYQKYLLCIDQALKDFFTKSNTNWEDYSQIAIPGISDIFNKQFAAHLSDTPLEKVLALSVENDLFTSQIPVALSSWKNETKGEKLLQIQVASGLQVNISVWEKQ